MCRRFEGRKSKPVARSSQVFAAERLGELRAGLVLHLALASIVSLAGTLPVRRKVGSVTRPLDALQKA